MLQRDATAVPTIAQSDAAARQAWYTTVVLMIAYTFSFLDRQILKFMVGPVKHDFGITDTQFAMLTGGAFGIFYTLMGLPIGWLADRYPRKWIISGGIALWSLMTVSCGATRSYSGLLFARVGVGVGEATLSPSAYSMLSDLFDRTRLPRAMSVYSVGIYIGAGLATILGGATVAAIARTPVVTVPLLGAMSSWHLVFFVVGLPGLLVALWAATLTEPRRKAHAEENTGSESRGFSLSRVWAFLSAYPRMSVALFIGSALIGVMSYMDAWYPELFIRTWHWDARLTGSVNGAASLTAGLLGMLTAGWWSARMLKSGRIDELVSPPALRAQLGAVFLLTVGIIGVSLGPLLPAVFTDYLFHDEHSLRYSLSLAAAIVAPLACLLLSLGLRQYRRRLLELDSDVAPERLRPRLTLTIALPLPRCGWRWSGCGRTTNKEEGAVDNSVYG
jgi:MFS family permease